MSAPEGITERQLRERRYHQGHAAQNRAIADRKPALDILAADGRQWWNSHWRMYDALLAQDVRGKRVVIPGCGFGDDACRLAELGADVYAFDISPDVVEIAKERATRFGWAGIHFAVTPAERTDYEDDFFDAALLHGVFHHLNIEAALVELGRILKPGALVLSHDPYTHSSLQRIRNSRFVREVLYPRMSRFIYGTDDSYLTEDEEKLNEATVAQIAGCLSEPEVQYFCMAEGRLLPARHPLVSKLDRGVLRLLPRAGRYLGGRCVIAGALRKSPAPSRVNPAPHVEPGTALDRSDHATPPVPPCSPPC